VDSFVIVTAPGRDCGFSEAGEAATAEEGGVPEFTAVQLFSFNRAGDMVTFPPGGTILSRFEADFSFVLSVSHMDSFATGGDTFGAQGFPGMRFGRRSALTSLAFLAAGDMVSLSMTLFIFDTSLFSPAAAAAAVATTGAGRPDGAVVLPPTAPQALPAPGPPPPPL